MKKAAGPKIINRRSEIGSGSVICPKCGSTRMPVVFTRRKATGTVRVRRCREDGCGHRVKTTEVMHAAD